MNRSGSAIVAILVLSCAVAEGTSPPAALPPTLSQYAPLNVSRISTFGENIIESAVHRELLNLPFFGVFDHLAFTVDGGTVTLRGQVLIPRLRDDAADVVANIEGVGRVVNLVTLLPDSPADNRIRLAVFTAIYGHRSMSLYATVGGGGAIHIIVRGGRVSLEGQVGSNADARRAAELASRQPGVVSITSHLAIGN
jgi:hyperosmotically inducible periplasmic protein